MNTSSDQRVESLRQSYEMGKRQKESLLEQQGRLRDAAESLAREARAAVEYMAEALSPGLVDDHRKASPDGLLRISTPDLAKAVAQDVNQRLLRMDAARVADRDADKAHDTLTARAAKLEEMVAQLTAELKQERQAKEEAQTELVVLRVQLKDAQRRLEGGQDALPLPKVVIENESPVAVSVPDERLPEWMKEWKEEGLRKGTYDQDCEALGLLARTGIARRSVLTRTLGEMWSKRPNDGVITRLLERFDRYSLIQTEQAVNETSGGAGRQYLLKLSDKGRDVCRLVLGLAPAGSQLDRLMKRHKSYEHVLLNLESGDLLRDAGYVVDLFPAPLDLPRGGHFAPDLIASLDDDTLFVEVERITPKNTDAWTRKWEIVYEATNGELYVVVANKRARGVMRSDILHCLGQRPLELYLTSVSEARGKGLQGRDVWIGGTGE